MKSIKSIKRECARIILSYMLETKIAYILNIILIIVIGVLGCYDNKYSTYRKEPVKINNQSLHKYTESISDNKTMYLEHPSGTLKDILLQYRLLYSTIEHYQERLTELENKLENSCNDVREETNNIINKFNGSINFWLVILGVLCGLAPIIMAKYHNSNNITFLRSVISSIAKKGDEIDDKINEFKECEKKRNNVIESIKKENNDKITEIRNGLYETIKPLSILQLYSHIIIITRTSYFQNSINRVNIAENLLCCLIDDALKYIQLLQENNKINNEQIEHVIGAVAEGLQNLHPFVYNNRERSRYMNNAITKLRDTQENIFNGDNIKQEDWDNVISLLNKIHKTIVPFTRKQMQQRVSVI